MTTVIQRREIVYGTLQDFLDDVRQLAEIEQANVSPHRKSFLDTLMDWFSSEDDN